MHWQILIRLAILAFLRTAFNETFLAPSFLVPMPLAFGIFIHSHNYKGLDQSTLVWINLFGSRCLKRILWIGLNLFGYHGGHLLFGSFWS